MIQKIKFYCQYLSLLFFVALVKSCGIYSFTGASIPAGTETFQVNYFENIAKSLKKNEQKIIDELMAAQGKEVDLGGYYHTDPIKVRKIMRPSKTFNQIIP